MINGIKQFVMMSAVAVLLGGCGTTRNPTSGDQKIGSASGDQKIYDESADGEKQIASALASAKANHKRVLVQFGANWCSGCHKLHDLLKNDPAVSQHLKNDYVWVLIDLDQAHNIEIDEKYGNPTFQGYPALVILEADGQQVLKSDTVELTEGNNYSPQKVTAFLNQWGPKR